MSQAEIRPEPELLNIKQAAALLNVSEISLRRWTNAGKLACRRVGGKRERRFRREDLMAFLEETDVQPGLSRTGGSARRVAHIMLEGVAIDYGSHLCTIYETDAGRTKLSVPFLADGLREGCKCFLIAGEEARQDIVGHLGENYPDLQAAIDRGDLEAFSGTPTGKDIYAFFEREFAETTRRGQQSLRVLGDMAWFLERGMSLDELTEFEMRFNQFLAHSYPVISLCQYDARKFSGVGILHAIQCHEDTFNLPLSRFLAS